jgi:tetratricopeptide (TPR) repeat protein
MFLPLQAQTSLGAAALLKHALYLADLYNWADAAAEFGEAEKLFLKDGDQRNSLYARLGKIRSNIERQNLPDTSAQLAAALNADPLLQTDEQLRMFCLIVKGDIDGEIDARAMRHDWEQVAALARNLGDTKWQYRAQAQLGLAAFYDGDLTTARKNVGSALVAATKNGDIGAQIRYFTAIGVGLLDSKMYQQALPYFDNALKIADTTPDAGYPFLTNGARVLTLLGLGQINAAHGLADDIVKHAQEQHRIQQESIALNLTARVAEARNDQRAALSALELSLTLAEAGGYLRDAADAQSLLADVYRTRGDLRTAERFATLAALSTQASADSWSVPQRLKTIAELQVSQSKYAEADRVYDQAAAFIDSLIGNYSTVLEKAALLTASSELYSQHFTLVAERFHDVAKAYHIVEQVRGRATTDLLMAGSVASEEAKKAELTVAQLRLKLMATHSANEVHHIRDQIFMAEQSRWITPDLSILNTESHRTPGLARVQHNLKSSAVILEYVVADPRSYCLVISQTESHIVRLASKHQIETLVAAYLKAIKAKQTGRDEGRHLYDVLLGPIPEAQQKEDLVVVRDGQLHLVPFDGFIDAAGRYVVEAHTVIYAPSAASFCLLTTERRRSHQFLHTLLAVGGITYNPAELKQVSATRGYESNTFTDLPASREEVLAAESAVHDQGNTLLIGSSATGTPGRS